MWSVTFCSAYYSITWFESSTNISLVFHSYALLQPQRIPYALKRITVLVPVDVGLTGSQCQYSKLRKT